MIESLPLRVWLYIFKLNGGAVSWRSNKQSCVALSTAEAEYMYIALSAAAQESLCLPVWLSSDSSHLRDI